jgi:hypothetical protein
MRPAQQGLNGFFRALGFVAGIAFATLSLSACGSDGNITVGVIATQPIPPLATLTPVPPPTATPMNTVPPTVTVPPTNTPEPSNCGSEHAEAGCDDPVCEACVCTVDVDGFCCGTGEDSGWDEVCVDITVVECIDACPCP